MFLAKYSPPRKTRYLTGLYQGGFLNIERQDDLLLMMGLTPAAILMVQVILYKICFVLLKILNLSSTKPHSMSCS